MQNNLFQADMDRTLVIAEVGGNHEGDPVLARESVYAAKEAGADVVKYQLYRAQELVHDKTPVLKHAPQSHATQRERFESLQLEEDVFRDLAEIARKEEIVLWQRHFFKTRFLFSIPWCRHSRLLPEI